MFSPGVGFEWTVDEAIYLDTLYRSAKRVNHVQERWTKLSRRTGAQTRMLREMLLLVLFGVIISSGLVSYRWWQLQQAETGIRQSMADEAIAWLTVDKDAYDSLIDPNTDKRWIRSVDWGWHSLRYQGWQGLELSVQDVSLRNGMAVVRTRIKHTGNRRQPVIYSRYRYYHKVDEQWLRISPQSRFWGGEQRYESSSLYFVYHEADADVVKEAAPKIEQVYERFQSMSGLAPPESIDKLGIEIHTKPISGWSAADGTLSVDSPLIALLPANLNDVDAFVHDVTGRLVRWHLYDTQPRRGDWPTQRLWRATFPGMQSWLMRELTGQPPFIYAGARKVLAEDLALRDKVALTDLRRGRQSDMTNQDWLWLAAAGESMIDYAVGVYGEETLIRFFDNIGKLSTWEKFIPATFGVSMEKFEAGWNDYLDELE